MESKVNDKSDKPDKPIRVLWDVKTPMRDGTLLSSEVYLPYEEGAFPAILQRTPYGNEEIYCVNVGKFFAQHGYAFVFQDVRGRGDSDGIFDEYNEGNDGYDTIEWIAAQPWCNGNVGMRGGSYEGAVQWDAARKNPPYLKAIIPQALVPDLMETIPFSNGIPRLENLQWLFFVSGRSNQCNILTAIDWDHILFHLPLKTMDKKIGKTLSSWQKILEHPNLDEFWKSNRASKEECSQMNIPMLFISGWHDDSLRGTLWAYQKVLENTPKPDQIYLLIGPWNHGGTGAPKQQLRGIDYGPQAVLNMREVHLKWFDYWLKGIKNEVSEWKRTQLFLMGENKWQNFDVALPSIEKGKLELYLNSDGNAQSSKGTGKLQRKAPTQETKDIFTYDPHNPVPDYPVLNLYGEEVDGS
ncbi:MAG: hydrolase, partial [Promethearchaeia archaeon]